MGALLAVIYHYVCSHVISYHGLLCHYLPYVTCSSGRKATFPAPAFTLYKGHEKDRSNFLHMLGTCTYQDS